MQSIPRSQIYHLIRFVLLLSLVIGVIGTDVISQASRVHARGPASVSGCPFYPADNIWNYDISNLPVHANSANFMNSIGLSGSLHPDFNTDNIGIPYTVVPGSQPDVPIEFQATDESDPGPYPIPQNAPVEVNSDRHVLVVNSGTCNLYEMFYSYLQANGSWKAYSGATWNLNSDALRPSDWTSADAAGLPILPGLVRYDEVASGVINHALRFTVSRSQAAFLWPARHFASSSTDPNLPPMGLRLRLKASVDISSFSSTNQVILTALKHYGMFVADNGSSWSLSGAPDNRWNKDDLHLLDKIVGSDFEAVDESSLQVSPDSGQARQPSAALNGNRLKTFVTQNLQTVGQLEERDLRRLELQPGTLLHVVC